MYEDMKGRLGKLRERSDSPQKDLEGQLVEEKQL